MQEKAWYRIDEEEKVPSPSLLIYPQRVKENIATMIRMTGGADKLRPHIKTHKMAEVVELQLKYGINKFKCATIAEAELLGTCKAPDVLLAMQPVGPNIKRFLDLMDRFPQTKFSTLVDHETSVKDIGSQAKERGLKATLYLDLNVGMDRTGIKPSEEALALYKMIHDHVALNPAGLHAYDGHIRNPDLVKQKEECDRVFESVTCMKTELKKSGLPVNEVIAGGSPSFPVHAKRQGVIASPGTTLLWDARYGESFSEMEFRVAAVLLTRVISKPAEGILCLDLGHKSVAPEMDFPRVRILGMESAEQIGQSEEHLVLRTKDAPDIPIGTVFYAIPMHICPTVAKYPAALTVEKGRITGSWKVAARDH
ncbi:D-serine deaminase, pyridoxal phosphate-dependent [Muriicola jejuensis]|uniref:D-TA family PLP-dependent enzyme n=1 Tax=Muriicola jejuensis TaxID=504488 RepID=A0A6P0UAW1_9FLAO|nr:D-TA family PLP-dependent enzyme [Muriicola jejuensis]NER10324.1 D-TA family PLP-dependent enzyme [Muriicola jejuensis]SMP01307.1 D-serine deaminase, pyridoxal phosphate-dependent [Muriicola jejuensis]